MKISSFAFLLLEITLAVSAIGSSNDDAHPFDVVSTDVTFRLYTPESPNDYKSLQTGQLTGDSLVSSRPFKFIIHGYTHEADKEWITNMKNEYLKKGAYNVIAVDWSGPASEILYSESAANTVDVGKYVALFIIDLHNILGVPYLNIHLIGHSLGAHVSGFCGKYLLATVNTTIARITGMDPAGPLFEFDAPHSRLNKGDAIYTDIIHTAGTTLGYYDECGDIDFYVNGGTPLQPGCLTRDLNEDDFNIACSHIRAYLYYTESINSLGFRAKECSSSFAYWLGLCRNNQVAIMGENVDQNLNGVFYLNTNDDPPFAKY